MQSQDHISAVMSLFYYQLTPNVVMPSWNKCFISNILNTLTMDILSSLSTSNDIIITHLVGFGSLLDTRQLMSKYEWGKGKIQTWENTRKNGCRPENSDNVFTPPQPILRSDLASDLCIMGHRSTLSVCRGRGGGALGWEVAEEGAAFVHQWRIISWLSKEEAAV